MNNKKKYLKFMKYVGNKYKYLNKIENELDKLNKESIIYIEPFLGGGSVLLNCGYKFKKSYGFDINNYIIRIFNAFKTIEYEKIQKLYNNLVCKYGNIGKNKEAYYNFRNEIYNKEYWTKDHENSNKDADILLYYLTRSCINSMIRFGPNGFNQSYGNRGRSIYLTKKSLNEIQNRLSNSEIAHYNFFDITKEVFDCENIIWFLDPPYVSLGSVAYKESFNEEKSNKFLHIIKQIKGKVIYTDVLMNSIQEKLNWRIVPIRKNLKTISPQLIKSNKNNKIEVMYCNF